MAPLCPLPVSAAISAGSSTWPAWFDAAAVASLVGSGVRRDDHFHGDDLRYLAGFVAPAKDLQRDESAADGSHEGQRQEYELRRIFNWRWGRWRWIMRAAGTYPSGILAQAARRGQCGRG